MFSCQIAAEKDSPFLICNKSRILETICTYIKLLLFNTILLYEKAIRIHYPGLPFLFYQECFLCVYLCLIAHRMNRHLIFFFLLFTQQHKLHVIPFILPLKPHILPRNPLIAANIVPTILNPPRLILFPLVHLFHNFIICSWSSAHS